MNFDDQRWDTVIETKQDPLKLNIRQVLEYRDLIFLFVKRDIAASYKQTILGPLWYLMQPVCTTVMCMIVFLHVAGLGTDGIPPVLFYSAGTILWAFYSSLITAESRVFTANKEIFGKVYFPRLTVPIAVFLGEFLKFLIQALLFIGVFFIYLIRGYRSLLSARLLLLPLVILWIGLQAGGLGLIISSITTKYRDLAKALSFFLSLLMYAAPVAYPLSEVSEKYRIFFEINPLTAALESFRRLCFGTGWVSVRAVSVSILWTIVFLAAGVLLFNRNEKRFVDVM